MNNESGTKYTLLIDTSSNKEIMVGITLKGKTKTIKHEVGKEKAQVVLELIHELLKNNQLSLHELTEIQVNAGPGSFTGLRVGVTIANTLGFLLKIPINGKDIGVLEEPVYQ